MRPAKKKAIIIIVVLLALAALAVCAFFAAYGIIYNSAREKHAPVPAGELQPGSDDMIHFLNTGSSDAILIESNGLFALVDCAEDSDNPRGFNSLEMEGYETKVIDYLKSVAGDENGRVTLEFVIGTHAHSDHLGGFDTLISDPDITVKEAYLKRYYEDRISMNEVEEWDNKQVYEQMLSAARERGVPVIQDLDGVTLELGDLTLTLYNTEEAEEGERVGENDNSLAVLVEKGPIRALLMGDVNKNGGVEKDIGRAVGKVDLIKVGHHGYGWSTSNALLSSVKPDIAVFTNRPEWVNFSVKMRLVLTSRSALYSTGEYNGIIAVMGDAAGDIKLYENIHK